MIAFAVILTQGGISVTGAIVRVTASDGRANPPGRDLEATAESPSFLVDRTPPRVTGLSVRRDAKTGGVRVRCTAADDTGPVRALSVRVDALPPRPVDPKDGVADEAREEVDVVLDDVEPGPHVVTVTARDGAGNTGRAGASIE